VDSGSREESASNKKLGLQGAVAFATRAADGKSANLMFAPKEQEFKCLLASAPNSWASAAPPS
jgi:hypothetical protein